MTKFGPKKFWHKPVKIMESVMDIHDAVHIIELALHHAKMRFENDNMNAALIAEVDKVIKVQPTIDDDEQLVKHAEFLPQMQQLINVWENVLSDVDEEDPRHTHYMMFCTGTQQAVGMCK